MIVTFSTGAFLMKKTKPAPKTQSPHVKINGIQRVVTTLQSHLTNLYEEKNLDDHQIKPFCEEVSQQIEKIHIGLRKAGCTPDKLTGAAQTAYRWLFFISKPETVKRHVESLVIAYDYANKLTTTPKRLFQAANPPVYIQFYNTRYLYKAASTPRHIKIVLNEAFIGAPPIVIKNLIYLCMEKREQKKLDEIHQYSRQPAFMRQYETLYSHQKRIKAPEGSSINLLEVFKRVNKEYFEDTLIQPRLGWSSRKSLKTFGRYQTDTDTLVISNSLDSSQIPAYVIDFVMYHELLHKQLGAVRQNGRMRAHTSKFRAAEKQFQFYQEASTFLEKLAQSR